jgi:polysaccharide export outer membrane protein
MMTLRATVLNLAAAIGAAVVVAAIAAPQSSGQQLRNSASDSSAAERSRPLPASMEGADPYFRDIYRQFYENYRLGPEDEIAVRVVGQPDYSIERTQITPFGRIYHPLLGEVEVVGLTVQQTTDKLFTLFSDYIRDPRVSITLITANSAKIGVLGEVTKPGILIMARPMTVLDAISAAGGVTDFGSRSSITVLRQLGEGRMQTTTVNLKRVMQAKGNAEDNPTLRAGDTLIVHGNFKKKFTEITRLAGFGYFMKNLID